MMRLLEKYRVFILTVTNKYHKWVVAAFFIVLTLMDNGFFGLKAIQKSIEGFYMLDMNFYNTKDFIQSYLFQIGEAGRNGYFYLLVIDLAFAVVFAVFQSVLLTKPLMYFKRTALEISVVLTVPLLRGLADIAENITMMLSLYAYPKSNEILFSLNSLITPVKWIFFDLSIAMIIGLLILRFVWRFKKERFRLKTVK